MTRCESYPLCSGTIYFPTAPSVIFILYPFYNFAYKALIFARVAGPIIPSTDKPFAF